MQPISIVDSICRYYTQDRVEVDPALTKLVHGKVRARDYAGLASCSSHFDLASHTVDDFKFLRQVEAFYKKNAILAVTENCTDAARHTFCMAEEACSKTNTRLRPYVGHVHLLDEPFRTQVLKMQRYITNVLGEFSRFLDELPYLVKVTPGATSHTSRKNSLPQLKMRMKLYATRRAFPYLKSLYHYYGFSVPRLVAVNRNRVELVPKNWKTHRTIACEPEGNIPLQLAFDTYAKRRLKRYGINLRDQFCNQRAAKEGSLGADKATVDFKTASDTVAYNAVTLVFPTDWLRFLLDVRSPGYRGVFGDGVYSKFSSMGNGSTFTIETLIFAAACHAVGSKDYLVYGDDVILEGSLFADYQRLTGFLGFTINDEKSFVTGPFRESCGLDVFNGRDVTPQYVRAVDDRKAVLCHLVNTMAYLADPGGKLEQYLHTIVKDFKLPLTPYQESTMAGIWIEPAVARTLGILYRKKWRKGDPRPFVGRDKRLRYIDYCKVYVAKNRHKPFVDSRGYYLWFLNKNSQVLFNQPWDITRNYSPPQQPTQTSSAPVYDHCYVRKRVCWREPQMGVPVHLYWWTELITARGPQPLL